MTWNEVMFRVPWRLLKELQYNILVDEYEEACKWAAEHEAKPPQKPDIILERETPEGMSQEEWVRRNRGTESRKRAEDKFKKLGMGKKK